jgi:hypothetical protein
VTSERGSFTTGYDGDIRSGGYSALRVIRQLSTLSALMAMPINGNRSGHSISSVEWFGDAAFPDWARSAVRSAARPGSSGEIGRRRHPAAMPALLR